MIVSRESWLVVLFTSLTAAAIGQEIAPNDRAETTQRMKRIAESLQIFETPDHKGAPVAVVVDPVLRYTDSTRRNTDASLWIFGAEGRPAAIVGIEHYPNRPRDPKWLFEVASLSTERISLKRGTELNWTARTAGAKFQSLTTMMPIAEQPPARLTQMKALQRRFTAHEQTPVEGRIELRPLIRPLYRYQDATEGVIDGVIMSFANGTNPEVLLILEARRSETGAHWQYALVQITGAAVTAELDGEPIWASGEADPPSQRDSYVNGWLEAGPKPTE